MSTLTIRNQDDELKLRLRVSAALNQRSMEEEARVILRNALIKPAATCGLGSRIHQRFAAEGGFDFDPPSRSAGPGRPPFRDSLG